MPSTACLVGLLAFAAICVAPRPGRVLSFDTFLHVQMGEEMLRSGGMVETDTTNWAVDHHYLDHEWVLQVVLAAVHRALGLEGLVLFTALMVGVTFSLVAVWMRRRGVGPVVSVGLLGLVFWSLQIFFLARPFLVTWVLAVVWTVLLDRLHGGEWSPRRWVLIAVPMMWLWANLHAGFFLGFFLLGLFGLAQLWRILTAGGADRPAEMRLFLWMVGGGQAALFASALNPHGFRLHAHFLVYLANQPLVSRIVEWQSPYFHQPPFRAALLTLAVLLMAWLASPRRARASETLLALGLLLVALRAQRNLPIFFLLTVPYVGVRLEEGLAVLSDSVSWAGRAANRVRSLAQRVAATEKERRGTLTAAALIAAAVIAVGILKLHPAVIDERKLPVAAADFIAERPELFRGAMFNDYNWGGYLGWRLSPDHKVFINGLQDHFGAAHQAAYEEVTQVRPGWSSVLDEKGVGWLIVPARSALATVLELAAEWEGVYGDRVAEIYVRGDDAAGQGAAAGSTPQGAGPGLAEPPNVLVVVLDTARPDALGAYGGLPADTPALDRLAAEGTVFERARSTSAWTLPAHGSLFTGLYPSRHGAHWEHQRLARQRVTLAELLASTHQTAAFSENPHITRAKGFGQGFATFAETWRRDSGGTTLEAVGRWLAQRPGEKPFLLFVNLMTPHLPYRPSVRAQERMLPEGVSEGEVARLRAFDEREARRYMTGDLQLDSRELEILRGLYRADVADADRLVEQLLALLEDDGELDDTLVVVVGDHGENLGDHGLMEHQLCLYETLLRVPLILRWPARVEAGLRDERPVQLVDLLPTILDAVGAPSESWPPMEGYSLLGAGPPRDRPVVAEYMRPLEQKSLFAAAAPRFDFTRFDRRLRSIQVGELKLILPEEGSAELYDVESDPGETRNLALERPEEVHRLRLRLEAWRLGEVTVDPAVEPGLDEETEEALRALGYLG